MHIWGRGVIKLCSLGVCAFLEVEEAIKLYLMFVVFLIIYISCVFLLSFLVFKGLSNV